MTKRVDEWLAFGAEQRRRMKPDLEFLHGRDELLRKLDANNKFGNILLRPGFYDWDEIKKQVEALQVKEKNKNSPEQGIEFDIYLRLKAEIFLSCCSIENKPPPQWLVHFIVQRLRTTTAGGRYDEYKLSMAKAFIEKYPDATTNEIAQAAETTDRSVRRWRDAGQLQGGHS